MKGKDPKLWIQNFAKAQAARGEWLLERLVQHVQFGRVLRKDFFDALLQLNTVSLPELLPVLIRHRYAGD